MNEFRQANRANAGSRQVPIAAPKGSRDILRDHLLYAVILAVYCLPNVFLRDLFFRDESRYGGVVKEMIQNDTWFTLTIGDAFYSDKPPLFFSLLRLATEIAGTTAPWVFFSVVTATAFFFVAASDAFLRAAGYDRRTVLSANLLLLSVPWVAIHMQLLRMDLLFGGFILCSLAFYVRGVGLEPANFRPLIGGLLAGLAVLTKGPFGVLIPLVSLAAFLAATGRLRRLLRADVLLSFLLMVLPAVIWVAELNANYGSRVFDLLFGEQILERAVSGRDSHRSFWLYPLWLGLTLMPWFLLTPALMVGSIRSAVRASFADSVPLPGLRLILSMLAASMLLLGLVAQKNIHYLLPLVPGLMILVAIAYAGLDAKFPRLIDRLYAGLGLVMLVAPPLAAWGFGMAPAEAQAGVANYVRPETLTYAGFAISLTAVPVLVAARLSGTGRLLAGPVSVAIMLLVVMGIVLPDLDRVYSPRHMAASFQMQVAEGQPILVYGIYRGSLSYHFDRPLIYVDDKTLAAELKRPEASNFVILRRSNWERRPELWTDFEKVDESRLEVRDVVLLRRRNEP